MSFEEIRRIWEYNRHNRLTANINCGYLRRCGKSEFLRDLIIEEARKEENRHKFFYLLVSSQNNSREYSDLVGNLTSNGIVFRIIVATHDDTSLYQLRSLQNSNSLFFSDEIPNIEEIICPMGFTLFAGVYSIQTPVHNFPSPFIPDQLNSARFNSSVEYFEEQAEQALIRNQVHSHVKFLEELEKSHPNLEVKDLETMRKSKFNFIIDSWKEQK